MEAILDKITPRHGTGLNSEQDLEVGDQGKAAKKAGLSSCLKFRSKQRLREKLNASRR